MEDDQGRRPSTEREEPMPRGRGTPRPPRSPMGPRAQRVARGRPARQRRVCSWRSRAGWPILLSKVVYPRHGARRAGVGPEPQRARPTRSGPLCLLVAVSIAAAGCQQEIPATAGPKKPDPAAPAARAVRVVPAAETMVARTVAATGTLAADEQVVLGTKVVGRLAEISVDLGSLVRKDQPVARIDTKDYQYRLDQAVAALQQARVRLGLPPEGGDDRVVPAQTAVVRQAKALLEQAQLNRDRMARLWDQQLIARSELDAAVSALQVAEGRYQDALEEVQNRQEIGRASCRERV